MPRWAKHFLGIVGVLGLAACASGPSSCSGSSGLQPLPSGFEPSSRIENGASVRLTRSGFRFIEDNLGPLASNFLQAQGLAQNGVIHFPVPETALSGTGYELSVCPGGSSGDSCVAEIDMASAQLSISPTNPHDVLVTGPIPVRLKTLPISGHVLWAIPIDVDAALSGGGNDDCSPGSMSFKNVDVTAQVSIEVERDTSHASRLGYSKLRVVNVELDQDQLVEGMHFCGEGLDDSALQALKGIIGPSVLGTFTGQVLDMVNQQLCLKANPAVSPSCPNGSTDRDGLCTYGDGSCVSIMLGLEGHANLGSLLASVSPGVEGGIDFVTAAGGSSPRPDNAAMSWGDLNPITSGATLGLFGGAVPRPVSQCVKPADLTLPTGIPIPDELLGNDLAGWSGDGPHVGFALSERFLNYGLGSAYNSGLLCLGIGTEQIPLLSTGTLGLLVPSLKYLTFQKQQAPLAMVVRPQKPPTLTVGNGTNMTDDPLLRAKLDQANVDFYVWSNDRFIRAFTAQFDLDVPLGLDISEQGLTPMLDKINISNPSVSNAGLLKEDPASIASALANIISGMAGQFLGGMKPIDVSGSLAPLGLTLRLQKEGVRKLHKGSDNFLGVFAAFGVAPSTKALRAETQAELISKQLDPAAFRITTLTEKNHPQIVLRAQSSLDAGPEPVEFSYRLDQGLWHSWTQQRELVIRDSFLLVQGHHNVFIKSRQVGRPETEDLTPTAVPVTIDVDSPMVRLSASPSQASRLEAWDVVSAPDKLTARYAFDEAQPSEWKPVAELSNIAWAPNAQKLTVQVRDEEGNTSTSSQALIRGRADQSLNPSSGGTGGCSVARPSGQAGTGFWLASAGLVGLSLLRWRKRAQGKAQSRIVQTLGAAALLVVAGSWTGCNCTDSNETTSEPGNPEGGAGGSSCGAPGADPCITLNPGLVGAYTSAAVASDGTLWVAGYNEADWDNNARYGDLVVGKWDPSQQKVLWQSVDGVPSDPAPDPTTHDLNSWRGGQEEPGDDVGQWTSLALGPDGLPQVAYFDFTHKALKYAVYDGASWTVSTIYQKDGAQAGRYAKLVMLGGKPVVAFQLVEPGDGGYARSAVMIGRAQSATPGSAQDWAFEEAAVDEKTPCREQLCPSGQKCVASTQQCTATSGNCSPACASGTACISGSCETIIDETKLDAYPEAIGDYISLAATSDGKLGLVYYDRIHGNLMLAREQDSDWATRLLDGQTSGSSPTDTGDVGIGASLSIDTFGDWHVAYVDGVKESLKYMLIEDGTTPKTAELVDDGAGLDGQPFADGKHLVGDDANVTVSEAGDVRIAYQDATSGELRFAVGAPSSGSGHSWTVKRLTQDGFGGFFPKQVVLNSATSVLNWWRQGGEKIQGDVRLIELP